MGRLLALVAVLVLSPAARAAPDGSDVRAQVEGLLGSFRPVSIERWRALGPEAVPVLASVARDRAALPSRRARALAALGVLRPSEAAPLVRSLAHDRSVPSTVRSAAVDVAPSVLGPETVSFLAPLLQDRDVAVRRRTAEALAGVGVEGCRVLLKATAEAPPSDPLARTRASCAEQLRTATEPAR